MVLDLPLVVLDLPIVVLDLPFDVLLVVLDLPLVVLDLPFFVLTAVPCFFGDFLGRCEKMIYFLWFLIYLLVVLDLPGWPLRTPR